jgi:hypothetical protein
MDPIDIIPFFKCIESRMPNEYARCIKSKSIIKIKEFIVNVFLSNHIDWEHTVSIIEIESELEESMDSSNLTIRENISRLRNKLEDSIRNRYPNLYVYVKLNPYRSGVILASVLALIAYFGKIAVDKMYGSIIYLSEMLGIGPADESQCDSTNGDKFER